ncbi:MAG: SDR family oxidoreductase [Bdellovibrionales bacterium]|nr:SDR family oxidoreductase [Bdellovibrionales bacterium]NQZ17661.1 SDR family oxidoreductase [Bdellovibrionales bacterium]
MDIKNKNIFITGANRGIGLSLAKKAASENMCVHAVCRNPTDELKEQLESLGAKSVTTWKVDMSKPESIQGFVDKIKNENIDVDILVNNAGQLTGGLLEEQSVEQIYQMIQVNLGGLIHLTRALLPDMLKLSEAKIVNNASVSGKMFFPCATTYAASKAGVVAFTECLKQELRQTNVSTLLLITPGVDTNMYQKIPELYSSHLDLNFLSSIPASEWADKVFRSIKHDDDNCWPKGSSYIGVKMGHHFPSIFERVIKPYFKRT